MMKTPRSRNLKDGQRRWPTKPRTQWTWKPAPSLRSPRTGGSRAGRHGDHPRNRDRGSHRCGRVDCRTDAGRRSIQCSRTASRKWWRTRDITATKRCLVWNSWKCEPTLPNPDRGASELARQGGGEGCGLWQPAADSSANAGKEVCSGNGARADRKELRPSV